MKLSATDSTVVEFFKANPGTCIRDLENSVKPEDFASPADFRAFCKGCHSRAHYLFREGILTRTLKLDAESNLRVWHYFLATEEEAVVGVGGTKGYKALLEAERAAWAQKEEDLNDGIYLYKLGMEKAEEAAKAAKAEAEALRAKLAAAEAEVAKLNTWMEAATA